MRNEEGTRADVMSVSIVAGPAAPRLLSKLNEEAARFPTDADPGQVIDQITRIARERTTNRLLILCDSERPPMAYASLFTSDNALSGIARLTRTAFAISGAAFVDAILGRNCDGTATCLMAEQIEFVDEVFFDGGDKFELACAIARALNPRAKIVPLHEASREESPAPTTGSFDFNAALSNAGWRRVIDGEALKTDGEITVIGYAAWRPFHPERFWDFLQQKADGVFRAKGFFWLASRMEEVGGLNLAGTEHHCASAGHWWATRDAASREKEMPERTRNEWKEPFGDRRQSFAVMALGTERSALQSQLDACLLSDAEMAQGPEQWRSLPDPFPSWSQADGHAHSHAHEHRECCDHHHDSEEHHCCHH